MNFINPAGFFGQTFYHQSVPLPLSCPQIKALSETLDDTIKRISAFKATEQQINDKLSKNLKENITRQCEKWNTSKESAPSIPYLEVQLETFRALKKEAISLSTKIDWTANTLGISQIDLESVIVEISQTLQEARKLEKQTENKNQKICEQISSQGPALTLP